MSKARVSRRDVLPHASVLGFWLAWILVVGHGIALPAAVEAHSPVKSSAPTACTCATLRIENGWCDVHRVGAIGAVTVRTPILYELLDVHGHDVERSAFSCPSCIEAIAHDGYCERDRIGFRSGVAYFSRLTWALVGAPRRESSEIACPICRAHSSGRGWCESHAIGQLGPFVISNRTLFDVLDRTLTRLEEAERLAAECDVCAIALITDGRCALHHVRFEDGCRIETEPRADAAERTSPASR